MAGGRAFPFTVTGRHAECANCGGLGVVYDSLQHFVFDSGNAPYSKACHIGTQSDSEQAGRVVVHP